MANFAIIKELCRQRGITLRELARKVGKKESSLHSIIQNNTTSLPTIELLAKELNVSPGIFFEEDYVSNDNLIVEIHDLRKALQDMMTRMDKQQESLQKLLVAKES